MPPAAAVWLSERIGKYVAGDIVLPALLKLGLDPATGTAARFATRLRAETERWALVIRESSLQEGRKRKEEG